MPTFVIICGVCVHGKGGTQMQEKLCIHQINHMATVE